MFTYAALNTLTYFCMPEILFFAPLGLKPSSQASISTFRRHSSFHTLNSSLACFDTDIPDFNSDFLESNFSLPSLYTLLVVLNFWLRLTLLLQRTDWGSVNREALPFKAILQTLIGQQLPTVSYVMMMKALIFSDLLTLTRDDYILEGTNFDYVLCTHNRLISFEDVRLTFLSLVKCLVFLAMKGKWSI